MPPADPFRAGPERLSAALAYLREFHTITGWCVETTALAMMEALWFQEAQGIQGGLAEIGVCEGKSFLAMLAAARPDEPAIAIDLFSRQDENPDYSGFGHRDVFERNLATYFPAARVTIVEENSLTLRGREAASGLRDIRFISIDGGHTRAVTLNDLHIADACLLPQGLCVLDDVFNEAWSGVVSGAFEFLEHAPGLVPAALFPNKLFLCRPDWRDAYAAQFAAVFGHSRRSEGREFHRSRIDVFGDHAPRLSRSFTDGLPAGGADPVVPPAQLAALQRQVDAMRASRSWRLTAPLRRLRRWSGR